MSLVRRVLALLDSLLLLILLVRYDWSVFVGKYPDSAAGLFMIPLDIAIGVGKTLFFALFFLLAGYAVFREAVPARTVSQRRWIRLVSAPVFALSLAGFVVFWGTAFARLRAGWPHPGYADTLGLFNAACVGASSSGDRLRLGLSGYASGSTGGYLLFLTAAAYLSDKYLRLRPMASVPPGHDGKRALLALRFLRQPLVPLVPVLLAVLVCTAAVQGTLARERFARERDWRPLPNPVSYPVALGGCEELGPSWRLPNDRELALLLASRRSPTGLAPAAWTRASAGGGFAAIAVATGRRSAQSPVRAPDRYRCPGETTSPRWLAPDFFTRWRSRMCRVFDSAALHTRQEIPLVIERSNRRMPTLASAPCMNAPTGAETIPTVPRADWHEVEFTSKDEFARFLEAGCAASRVSEIVCSSFGRDGLSRDETTAQMQARILCPELLKRAVRPVADALDLYESRRTGAEGPVYAVALLAESKRGLRILQRERFTADCSGSWRKETEEIRALATHLEQGIAAREKGEGFSDDAATREHFRALLSHWNSLR
jgi:hypothetical protein